MPADFREFMRVRCRRAENYPFGAFDRKQRKAYFEEVFRSGTPITTFTYAAMKEEFLKSFSFLQSRGYDKEDCAWGANESISVKTFFTYYSYNDSDDILRNDPLLIYTLMALIIKVLYLIDNGIPLSAKWFGETLFGHFIRIYREGSIGKLSFSAEDIRQFELDIERAEKSRDKIIPLKDSGRVREEREVIDDDCYIETRDKKVTRIPDKDGKQLSRMKEKLSENAIDMLTEFTRKDHNDPDGFEKAYLTPNGFALTDKLREFIELYDGRAYIYERADNCIDYPRCKHNPAGFRINVYGDCIINFEGHYYLKVMDFHDSTPSSIYMREDGALYDHLNMDKIADSPEEFFEEEAERRRFARDIMSRRVEIENKYFMKEFRTASMM